MKPRVVHDQTTTPDGERLELVEEAGHFVLRLAGVPLMSSAMYGSEQAMARFARVHLAARKRCKILVGGLGMGFTLRAALDEFGEEALVTVAELLPQMVTYNRGVLGPLARHPLRDPRTKLITGDVRKPLHRGGWDAILMDVDNGPDAFTTRDNTSLYSRRGAARMARALAPGGILVVWSAYPSPAFEHALQSAGLQVETRRVRARGPVRKGPTHTLFLGHAPRTH